MEFNEEGQFEKRGHLLQLAYKRGHMKNISHFLTQICALVLTENSKKQKYCVAGKSFPLHDKQLRKVFN